MCSKTPPLRRYMKHLRHGEKLLVLTRDGSLREVVGLEYDHKRRRVNYEPGPEYRLQEPPADGNNAE